MRTTKIGDRDVPINPGPKTVVTFSAGRGGPDESGDWEFWTTVTTAGKLMYTNTARCRSDADPGERFRRMEGLKEYESAWKMSRNADQLRPATIVELESWFNSHCEDARHAGSGEVGGHKFNTVQKDGRYIVELA